MDGGKEQPKTNRGQGYQPPMLFGVDARKVARKQVRAQVPVQTSERTQVPDQAPQRTQAPARTQVPDQVPAQTQTSEQTPQRAQAPQRTQAKEAARMPERVQAKEPAPRHAAAREPVSVSEPAAALDLGTMAGCAAVREPARALEPMVPLTALSLEELLPATMFQPEMASRVGDPFSVAEASPHAGSPQTEAAPRAEAAFQPAQAPQPAATPQLAQVPEPAAVPQPAATPQLAQAPQPAAAPQFAQVPEPAAATEPAAAPEPAATPQSAAAPEPATIPEPAAATEPAAVPQIRRCEAEGAAEASPSAGTPDAPASDRKEVGRKAVGRRAIVGLSVLVAAILVSLFVDPGRGLFSFADVQACYELWFNQFVASLAAPLEAFDGSRIVYFHADYPRIVGRIGSTFAAVLCGAAAAIAGLLFEVALKDRLALGPIAGVSSASGVGDVVLVALFGMAAPALLPLRWLAGAALAVLVTFVFMRAKKGERASQAARAAESKGAMAAIAGAYFAVWSVWQLLVGSRVGLGGAPSVAGWATLVVVCAAGVVPVIVLRSRMGALEMSDEEAKALGVEMPFTRYLVMVCAAALLVVAQVHIGPIALFAVVAPAISRQVFGPDFGDNLLGCALIGSILLVLGGFTGFSALAVNAFALAMLSGMVVLRRES